MQNALIICTYMRPSAMKKLLDAVMIQTHIPQQIIIVDGSTNNETQALIASANYDLNINYYLVDKEYRGLTKQRNYGVERVHDAIEIVSFLDDDIVLAPTYFEEIKKTFFENKNAIGVGGIDLQENRYVQKLPNTKYDQFNFYEIDGWIVKEPLRYKFRKIFGLMPHLQPDMIPAYSHGRSGFPPNGKIYIVEHLIGMSMSFKKELFYKIPFSKYFEGYGLYEDFDFCVRALPYGNLYVNTNAQVWHFHEPSGRPNLYKYGKMDKLGILIHK